MGNLERGRIKYVHKVMTDGNKHWLGCIEKKLISFERGQTAPISRQWDVYEFVE